MFGSNYVVWSSESDVWWYDGFPPALPVGTIELLEGWLPSSWGVMGLAPQYSLNFISLTLFCASLLAPHAPPRKARLYGPSETQRSRVSEIMCLALVESLPCGSQAVPQPHPDEVQLVGVAAGRPAAGWVSALHNGRFMRTLHICSHRAFIFE